MSSISTDSIRHIHMIGTGGIGMSALARLFLHEGKKVSGSDRAPSKITDALVREGVEFCDSQTAENITDDIGLVVYTEAMPQDHPELVAAREERIKTVNYFEALGMVANEYYLIAIAGTHGKTTTTAMLTDVLEEAHLDPTAIVGSLRSKTGSNFRAGKSKYCVVEACEYRRDFLHLTPDLLIITNIEAEHLDYYKDLADVQSAFRELGNQVRENGTIVANLSDEKVLTTLEGVEVTMVDYTTYFDPLLTLKQPGVHNQMNAAAALAAADTLGIKTEVAKNTLRNFAGTWRRFEYKGELNGAPIYDDYAHHPTEIAATLAGAHELYSTKKLLVVYQPHLDSRTEKLFDDFVRILSTTDHLILTPAYVARALPGSHDSTKRLAEEIKKHNERTEYIETFEDIVSRVRGMVSDEYVVLVMGAGDVTKIAATLTQ